MIFIGIDPPAGVAVWNTRTEALETVQTTDFWGTIELIKQWTYIETPTNAPPTVIIEDPCLNRPVFFRKGQNARAMQRIAQNVGMNKETAQLIIQYCRWQGIAYQAVPPRKRNATKHNSELFQRLTGWKERTSEHGRDAAMLVLGRKH